MGSVAVAPRGAQGSSRSPLQVFVGNGRDAPSWCAGVTGRCSPLDGWSPRAIKETERSQRQMMSKGERTREQLLEQAAALFNRRGYEAASISEVMAATGLQKGGVYRHFESKQALVLAAFEHSIGKMRQRFAEATSRESTPLGKIRAIISVYGSIPSDPPVPGGCPILNASVEADDGDPELRAAAIRVLDDLKGTLRRLVRAAQKASQLEASVNPDVFANVLVAQLEGAVMLSTLYRNDTPMRHTRSHLERWLSDMAP